MSVAGGRRAGLAVVVGVSFVGVPAAVQAAPAGTDALTGVPSAQIAGVDERVLVRGRVTADEVRPVALQKLVGRTWRTVDTVTTQGRFALTVPTRQAGVGFYRVSAPASGSAEAEVTDAFTIGIGEGDTKAHAFLTSPPLRWNPCATIGYRVNLQGAPTGALTDVRRAVNAASVATGLRFRYEGTTKVVPGAESTSVPDPYPADTQLVIAWSEPADTLLLQNRAGVLGVGGVYYDLTPQKIGKNTWYQAVQGYVVLNSTKDLPGGFGPGRTTGELGTWGQVIMHEVGHTLGLDHPVLDDKAQIMYPETTYKKALWGRGDLVGLRKVGAVNGCFGAPEGPAAAGPQSEMRAGVGLAAGVGRATVDVRR